MLYRVFCVLIIAFTSTLLTAESFRAPKKVVLIVIDTLRADHLPLYGYKVDTAPFLTKIGNAGVVFEKTLSSSSWTSPATASIHTGLYPFQHGVKMGMNATRRLNRRDSSEKLNRIPDQVETLAETLKSLGYRTFALTDNGNICEALGFAQGFDRFHNFSFKRATAKGIEKKVMSWEQDIKASERYFLYLHYMDPHAPYNKRKPWFKPGGSSQKNIINAYNSEINYTDQHIERLYERFKWSEDTLIIVTSDHGEEFWEHGKLGHGKELYLESVHVPLIFYASDQFVPARIKNWTSILDIVPTVRELFGVKSNNGHMGQSLVKNLQGSSSLSPRPLLAEIWKRLPNGKRVEQYALTNQEWRYHSKREGDWFQNMWSPEKEKQLYNVDKDWGENSNLSSQLKDQLTKLEKQRIEFDKGSFKFDPVFEAYDFSEKISIATAKKRQSP